MIGTNEVQFSKHRELHYLPKKIANFTHMFHAYDFRSLQLPPGAAAIGDKFGV